MSLYQLPDHKITEGVTYIKYENSLIPLEIFGDHNLMNMMGALNICKQLEVSDLQFYNAMSTFMGGHLCA